MTRGARQRQSNAPSTARLLAMLITTPVEQLESFRERCIGPDSTIAPAVLTAAQELLTQVASILVSQDERCWRRLEKARDDLCAEVADHPNVLETASIDEVSPIAGASLPFAPKSARHTEQTVGIGEMSPLSGLVLPFVATAVVELTIEQYASLYATCELHPDRRAATHAQYGITDEAARGAVDTHWRQRLDADPDERRHFDAMVKHYRAWLTTRG